MGCIGRVWCFYLPHFVSSFLLKFSFCSRFQEKYFPNSKGRSITQNWKCSCEVLANPLEKLLASFICSAVQISITFFFSSLQNELFTSVSVPTERPTLSRETSEPSVTLVGAAKHIKSSTNLYIGLAVGLGLFVLLLIAITGWWAARRHTKHEAKHTAHYENKANGNGSVEFRSRVLSSSSSLGSTAPLIRQRSFHSRLGSNFTQVSELELELDEDWEIDRCQLNLLEKLGEGAFGRVMKAQAAGVPGLPHLSLVAVKMLKG